MGTQEKYTHNGNGTEFTCTGVVHGADIIDTHKKVLTQQTLSKLKIKIANVSQLEVSYTSRRDKSDWLHLAVLTCWVSEKFALFWSSFGNSKIISGGKQDPSL